ncbi:MAG: phosphate signaling complex protein PhoU [Planctomycetes bacterium]|nr:phosphate signaling complex protein PhoU [Planctomycetota bacterium]
MPKRLHKEFDRLKKMLLELSALVEDVLHKSVASIERRDGTLAHEVLKDDPEIDHREVDVEEECLKILALHQPVANDLRFIVAVLKINNDLERIGDLAVNIAERGTYLADHRSVDIPFDFYGMAEKAQSMVKRALDALIYLDAPLARQVCAADDEVDALDRHMFETVREAMRAHPENVDELINFLAVSRHLERIADHATNIAEDVIYMIDGEIVRHRTDEFKPPGSREGGSGPRASIRPPQAPGQATGPEA